MTRVEQVRVGIIGAGNVARDHIRGYQQAAEFARVVAVADVHTSRARHLADRAGGAEVFNDYLELIASSAIDAVDICLPHHLHKDAIVAAAASGKHILCEKPLCLTLSEAQAVTKAVGAAGVTLMCAHNQLFLPVVAAARDMVRDGKIGRVYTARTTDIFANPHDPKTFGWRVARATSGGGELIDTGYHPTYLLLHLVASQPTRVAAMLSQHRLTFLEGEDSAQVLVDFADGTIGNIVTSWAYEPPGNTERFSLAGEAGSLWSDGRSLQFKPRGGHQTAVIEGKDDPDTYALEIVDFIDCLREGRRPIHTAVEGVKVLELILGAYASAERQAIVDLKDFQPS